MRNDATERGTSGMTRYSHQHDLLPRIGLFADDVSHLPYDYDDILALIAPRKVLVVQPLMDRDAIPEDVRAAVANARIIYSLFGAPDNLELQEPDDYGRLTTVTQDKIIEWMEKILKTMNNENTYEKNLWQDPVYLPVSSLPGLF
jgi:hypothetical protein